MNGDWAEKSVMEGHCSVTTPSQTKSWNGLSSIQTEMKVVYNVLNGVGTPGRTNVDIAKSSKE